MDSDGDGRHNGIELGDPWCQWTKENKYPLQLATSHPGKRNEYYFTIPKSYQNKNMFPQSTDSGSLNTI